MAKSYIDTQITYILSTGTGDHTLVFDPAGQSTASYEADLDEGILDMVPTLETNGFGLTAVQKRYASLGIEDVPLWEAS